MSEMSYFMHSECSILTKSFATLITLEGLVFHVYVPDDKKDRRRNGWETRYTILVWLWQRAQIIGLTDGHVDGLVGGRPCDKCHSCKVVHRCVFVRVSSSCRI